MSKTKKRAGIVIALATLVAAGVGGAAVNGTASAAPAALNGTASAAPAVHTLKFASITKTNHSVGRTSFVSTDVDRHKGKIVGYDALSGKYNVHTQVADIFVAAARKGGFLYVTGTSDQSGEFTGRVTGGSGIYKGAKGTVVGHQVNNKRTNVVVKYHL